MIILILILLGLALGSFANAFVWRFHESEQIRWSKVKNKQAKLKQLSILSGRSMCPDCHHQLSSKDLIPVFSWLSLKGRCRYCNNPISAQYPIVELITAFLFVFSYIYWPYGFHSEGVVLFIFWLIFLVGFMSLSIIDLKWRLLPNKLVNPLILLALLQIVIQLTFFNGDFKLVLGAIFGVIFSAGVFYAIFQVSDGKWIGGGDVKLAVALGLLLGGPSEAILMVFLASLIGSAASLLFMLTKKIDLKSTVAFGPLLMISTVICYLFGVHIIDWYKNFIF